MKNYFELEILKIKLEINKNQEKMKIQFFELRKEKKK